MAKDKKKKNTYRFKSFNEQISEVKVIVRRISLLKKDCEEKTYVNDALQQWFELNCSQQFTSCYTKLSPLCQSLPQLVHHLPQIIDILKEGLTTTGHGTEPLLDIISHLALDLQQDFYPWFRELFPTLQTLLNAQDAQLVENVFKTLAHIIKVTWRTMLENFSHTFQILSSLLQPPTKHHVQKFAAESFAFLVRKHQSPEDMVVLLCRDVEKGLVPGVSALLFETIKGLQYKFNTCAEKYVPILFQHAVLSGSNFKQIFKNILSLIVKHITKNQTGFIWDILLQRPSILNTDRSELCTFVVFQLECISVMLDGGRHTYLIESGIVCDMLVCLLEENLPYEEVSSVLTSTTEKYLRANKQLMMYLNETSVYDITLVTSFLDNMPERNIAHLVDDITGVEGFEIRYLPLVNDCIVKVFEESHTNNARSHTNNARSHTNNARSHTNNARSHTNNDRSHTNNARSHTNNARSHTNNARSHTNNDRSHTNNARSHTNNARSHRLIKILAKIALYFEQKDILNKHRLFSISDESEIGKFILSIIASHDIVPTDISSTDISSTNISSIESNDISSINISSIGISSTDISSTNISSIESNELKFYCLKIVQMLKQDISPPPPPLSSTSNNITMYGEFVKACGGVLAEVNEVLKRYPDNVVLLQAYYQLFKKVQSTDVDYPNFSEVFDMLKGNLIACNSTRYLTLSILSLYPTVHYTYNTNNTTVTVECRDVINCIEAELTNLSLHTYRDKLMYCSNLRYSAEALPPPPYTEFRVRYLLGCLQWNLALVWTPLTHLIVDYAVNDTTKFWTVFSEVLMQTSSHFNNLQTDQTVATQHSELLAKFDCSKSDTIQRTTDLNNFKLLLWKLMSEIPTIVEPKSRIIVPYFLTFMSEKYHASYGFKMTDIAREKSTGQCRAIYLKDRTTKEKGIHLNDELRAYLKLLSLFVNPKALYKQDVLYQTYFTLLSNKQSDVQKLAFECIASFKEEHSLKYREDISALIDDVNFRDQLTKFNLSSSDSIVSDLDRDKLFPLLLHILFGKMGSRMGHSKGKAGSKQRQGVVLRWLQGCREGEIKQFIDLVNKQFGINNLPPSLASSPATSPASSFLIIPLGMQTAYLKIIKQTLNTLPSTQLQTFIISITTALLSLNSSTRHCLDNRTLIQPHTLTPLKALRQLTLKVLVKVFTVFIDFDFEVIRDTVIREVIEPLICTLASESLQYCSPLLLLLECWSSSRAAWLQAHVDGKPLLSYVFALLTGKGVIDSVVTSVLNIVFNLLDDNNIGLVSPHIPSLVNHIHSSITKLSEKKEGNTLKLELQLLSRLSTSVTDPSLCQSLISSLLHSLDSNLLYKCQDVVNALQSVSYLLDSAENTTDKVMDATMVTTDSNVTMVTTDSNVTMVTTDSKLLIDCRVLYRLLGTVKDYRSRGAVCQLLRRVGNPASDVLEKLHAMNVKVIDEPDFDLRLAGYRESVTMVTSVESSPWLQDSVLPILYTSCYTVMCSDEMALRDSASHATMRLLDFIVKVPALYNVVVEDCVIGFIKKGLKNQSQVFRNEATILLQHIVKVFSEHSRWSPFLSLVDISDPEVDFFENIRHIQPHRRTRAIARLKVSIPTLPSNILWDFILPLLHPLFSLHDNKYHNTLEEALNTLTEMCKRFKWVKYYKLIKRYLKMLAMDIENKIMVKVIGAVLAGFHEPVLEDGKVLRIITKEILPKLICYLTKETPPPQGHKKSITYQGDQVAIQAPIAICVVSLIQQLPEHCAIVQLPPVILRVINTLKNRAMDVRNTTRQTLASIARDIGHKYLGYLVNEMRATLNKGYMLHVLAYTLHHLLQELSLKPTELDNATLSNLMEVFIDGVSGATAQDRDRGEKKNSLPEAKKCYTPVCIEICCSVVAVSQIQLILKPVKQMVEQSTHSKMKGRCEEVLRCMINGLLRNPLVTPTVAMVMCHELLNDEQLHSERKSKVVDTKVTIYDLPDPIKRGGAQPAPTPTSNKHLIQEFALQVVSTLLKRNVLSTKVPEHCSLLDPFVATVTRCLESPAVKTQVLALRCLSLLFEEPHLLPSLCSTVSLLSSFAFDVLRNHTKSTNSGLMLELIFSSFKILTTILREYNDYQMTEPQIKVLVQYITEDIYNRNRQATAFSLLKAILSRNIALPEIVELLESIAELSVTGQTDIVRIQCRQVFVQYLLNYPIGKKLEQYITFITKQLEYTHKEGRMSALELLSMLIDKLPKHKLRNYTIYIFICLSTCIINDECCECRKAATVTLSALMTSSNEELQNKLVNVTLEWCSDKQLNHKYLAVQLVEIFSSIEGEFPAKKLERFVVPLAELIKTLSCVEEDVTMTTTRDQVLYLAVMVIIKLGKSHKIPVQVYERLGLLQAHPHQWIRFAGSQLLGQLLSSVILEPTQEYFANGARDKMAVLTEQTLSQLKSPNLLSSHVDQITKNVVYLTRALLEAGEICEGDVKKMSVSHIVHKMTVLASVESSQNPKIITKRSLVMKWIAALCTSTTDPSLIHPFLPSFLQTLQREMKNTLAPDEVKTLATEIMQLLRVKFGKEVIASALIAADRTDVEKKRKRKRDAALQAIVEPEKSAKRRVKINLSKRMKRKEKYKLLKSKQFHTL